jgi:acyl-CoA dehydrogenase
MSSAFAFTVELAMLSLGGKLKRKEKITGRFADALAWMYFGTASLKQFEDDGRPASQLPFVSWACEHGLYEIQQALGGIIDNLPNALVRMKLRWTVFPLGRCTRPPSDRISGEVARGLLDDGEARLALSRLIYVPDENDPGLGRLESALKLVVAAAPARKKMKSAVREKKIPRGTEAAMAEACVTAGILTEVEARAVAAGAVARNDLIQVDSFTREEYSALFPRG